MLLAASCVLLLEPRLRRRIDEILALAYANRVEVNDSLARIYSRRVRGLRRADPCRIRLHQ
jgi:hypothetical protein